MSRVFFTSDTHYGHSNIVRGTTRWDLSGDTKGQSCRDFDTLEEHNKALVEGINKVVGKDDILYHLGDWSFGGLDNIWKFRNQLRVDTIHLIFGNHDHHIRNNKVFSGILEALSGKISAKEMFTTTQDVLEVKLNHKHFFMSHYSHQVWNGSHKGIMHCFGHSHDTLEGIGKSMDVGMDSAKRILGEYRPFSLEEVTEILDKRPILFIDHHDKNTNWR